MDERIVVVDTNLLLDDANIIFKLSSTYDKILVPLMVLRELDDHKFKPNTSYSAREAIRAIQKFKQEFPDKIIHDLDQENSLSENLIPDFVIINAAEAYGADLATKDVSMAIVAEARGIKTTIFDTVMNGIFHPYTYLDINDIFTKTEIFSYAQYFSGKEYKECLKLFSSVADKELDPDSWHFMFISCPSSDIIVYANNPVDHVLERIDNVPDYRSIKDDSIFLKAKDEYQICAIYALRKAPNVLITGKWGSGKSLVSTAYALANNNKKTFISRPPVGISSKYDIGFLPGDKEEKMMSWFAGFMSALYYLFSNTRDQFDDKNRIKYDFVRDTLFREKFEAVLVNAIQGMSLLKGDILIVDEIQLIDIDYISMILSRGGKESKIILTGDLAQTYNVVKPSESGLLKLLRILPHPCLAYVDLKNTYRSELTELAEKLQDRTLG